MPDMTNETMTTEIALPVTVTPRAARQIAKIVAAEGAADGAPKMLRLSVSGGGCSGFQYHFELDEKAADDDLVVEQGGIKVLIDATSLEFLHGAELDYADELIGASFKVNNPNATSSCGCGTSFSV
jgi:iron-sulfur cluster insertion protein